MSKILQQAVAEAARLPEAEQDRLGREILHHLEKLQGLRAEIDRGVRSLDSGHGGELDIEALIARARQKHAAE